MSFLRNLRIAADKNGLQVRHCGDGHYQVTGARLVNYWPASKKKTAYRQDDGYRERGCSPSRVIELALERYVSPVRNRHHKEKPRDAFLSRITNPTGRRLFYSGTVPPWCESLGEFQELEECDER